MTLTTAELLSIHKKNPNAIISLKVKFDFDAKKIQDIMAEVELGGLYFSSVPVELPINTVESAYLKLFFVDKYGHLSRHEMPENGILKYENYPKKRKHTRPTMYIN